MEKLGMLSAWADKVSGFFCKNSAQSYMARPQFAMATGGSACGAADPEKKEEKPSACGSACGTSEPNKKEETPSSACGAADPEKKEEKPSACGSACGAADPDKK